MKFPTILFWALCALFSCSANAQMLAPGINDDYSRHVFRDPFTVSMPYRMLSPEKIKEGKKYPLVLFLHGAGERGDDNESQLSVGANIFSNPANREIFEAFVVFPQCNERTWTGKIDERTFMPGAEIPEESPTERSLMNLLDTIVTNNPVDTDRIYLIGVSMGAIAAYDLACRYPERFAAVVPICGAVNPDRLKDAKNVKFYIFHGEKDEEIPVISSRTAYRALKDAGADVEYSEISCVGHECWPWAFNYPTLLPWLFSKSRATAF